MKSEIDYRITADNLSRFEEGGAPFVTFGEVMIRDTPADMERAERTRLVRLSPAGSEFTLAVGLSRLGVRSAFVTRVPRNPYGFAVQNAAREHGIDTGAFVWAPATEPIGRFIYEIGRTPRRSRVVYQRMHSAASRLDRGMVKWDRLLEDARIFHVSGITFGLARHSGYEVNYNERAFREAIAAKPPGCVVGLDLNYRSTLWSASAAKSVTTPILTECVDVLITTIEDIAQLFDLGIGGYSATEIMNGDIGEIEDDDLKSFVRKIIEMFDLRVVGITLRYPDSFEHNRWESAAMDRHGNFHRSATPSSITLVDRLGGGDTWNAGFYYGLISSETSAEGIRKGVVVGDAYTRLKQTVMFDLPIIDKQEVEDLLRADLIGGGKRTSR